VPIDPTDIEAQRFRIVFRGYDVEAVDAFLDQVQRDMAELIAARESLRAVTARPEDAPAATQDPAPAGEADGRLPGGPDDDAAGVGSAQGGPAARALRTLVRAESMAEQTIADAVTEADEVRARAEAEAERILAAARTESGRVEAELQQRREREIGALVLRTHELQAEIDRLRAVARQCQDGLRDWLAAHERLLGERLPVLDPELGAGAGNAPEALRPAA